MPAETMISRDALTKRLGHFTAVDQVSFAVAVVRPGASMTAGGSGRVLFDD